MAKASQVVNTEQFGDKLEKALLLALSKHMPELHSHRVHSIITDTVSGLRNIVDYHKKCPPRPSKNAFEYFATRELNKHKASFDKEKLREMWEAMPQSTDDRYKMYNTKDYYEEMHQQRIEEWDDWKLTETGAAAYQLFIETEAPKYPTIAWEALSDEQRWHYVNLIKS